MRALAVTLVATSLGVLCAFACSESTPAGSSGDLPEAGVDGSDASDGAPPEDAGIDAEPTCAMPGIFGSEDCQRCLAARCCAPITACTADPDCSPLNLCNLECRPKIDAGGCRQGCIQKYPAGESALNAIDLCGIEKSPQGCRDECATSQ